ncbi:MAG: response regulator transcription factor [Kineosporiaceae bacterium]|jgi:two-component system OmpR family response regulator
MKILVVEDDRRIATSVKRGLEFAGFDVDVSFDGEDGLWRAREFHYDLVILDLMLPCVSGLEICTSLREAGDWTPILVLTARDGERDETSVLHAGADDYLTKPFSFPRLIAHVQALLRRMGSVPVPVEIGDLRLDSARHRCWRGDHEVTLTAREFSVLEYLVRRAGQVVRKSEILDGVWEYDFEGDPNIVEVYIGRLRRKIDEPFGRRDIETLRGAGYRIGSS